MCHDLRAQVGCRCRPGSYGAVPHSVAANTLDRQFDVAAPNIAWVTDITYIRTHEGWLYLVIAESFFQSLKRERIKRRVYSSREQARQDVFNYIEMFCNPTRRHNHAAKLSLVNYQQHDVSEAMSRL